MTTKATIKSRRLPASPSQIIDREHTFTFTFEGATYSAYQGDTIASALASAGVKIFSRSFKYHRRRGLLCVSGDCPNCMVQVDGVPDVRSCQTRAEPSMAVAAQNAWPSLTTDLMSATQLVGRFLPVGFYYKTFMRPKALWPLYEEVLRRAAGLGEVDPQAPSGNFEKTYKHADVAVIGGGPAGLHAALASADAGAEVLLLEERETLGGHLRYDAQNIDGRPMHEVGATLAHQVTTHKNISVMTDTLAFGVYDHHWIGAVRGEQLIKTRAGALVVTTGAYEQPLVFPNNDLPGIMLSSGVAQLVHLWAVLPGEQAVVVSANPRGLRVALDLHAAGVEVILVAELRHQPEPDLLGLLQAAGIPVETGVSVERADGGRHVERVSLRLADGTIRDVGCDLLVLAAGYYPAIGLLYQAGAHPRWDEMLHEFVPTDPLPDGVFAAGEVAGTHTLDDIYREGTLAGLQSAQAAGFGDLTIKEQIERLQIEVTEARARRQPWTPTATNAGEGKKDFVCFCEDVTQADIRHSIEEGYDSIELLKRYSTVSMGPCQGKMCSMAALRLCAQYTDQTILETGTTTSRPPIRPIPMGALGGQLLEPVRVTPLHHWHLEHGATMMNAGQWKRAEHYGNPDAEVRAVREAVGLIDISTLGKIHLHGPDVPALLERLYTNRWQNLDTGRVRYGVMTNDEGIILDDGITAHLQADFYYMTTTSSGAGSIHEWIEWWLQSGWQLNVQVINATELRAAMNLTGPHARNVLAVVTEGEDLSSEAFPYMHARQLTVAGAPAVLLRIGFTGELSYEIHVPAGYGLHVWQALMQAGADYGIQPFGVETQRVLRLEKGHIIVGQDTDALTNPYEANMDWAVKLIKDDFLGKYTLTMQHERGPEKQLVGFTMPDGTLPEEANQIVRSSAGTLGLEIIGRVTSARYSPTLDRVIGLCWLPAAMTTPGTEFTVRVRGELKTGVVAALPFYDPENMRLHA